MWIVFPDHHEQINNYEFLFVLASPFLQSLIGVVFFLGLFGCFFGHKFFKTGVFLLGLFTGSLVSYILISIAEDESLECEFQSFLYF